MPTLYQDLVIREKWEIIGEGQKRKTEKWLETLEKKGGEYQKVTKKMIRTASSGWAMYDKQIKLLGKNLKSSMLGALSITLPLMFGFQAVGKAMKSLLDPALDMVGATELYQQFLALKYLPTALDQLDNVIALGDEWDAQSDAQKKAEGDALLLTNQLADLVSYTAQAAQTGAALGEAIPLIGRNLGALAGVVLGTGTGLAALSTESGRTMTTFSGLGQAVGILTSDSLTQFAKKLGLIKDENLPDVREALSETTDKFSETTNKITTYTGSWSSSVSTATSTIKTDLTTLSTDTGTIGTALGTGFIANMISGMDSKKKELEAKVKECKDLMTGVTPVPSGTFGKPEINPFGGTTTTTTITSTPMTTSLASSQQGDLISAAMMTGKYATVTDARRALGLAEGGLIRRPMTALLGERGPEAVIPLDRIGSIGGINVTINTASIGGNVDVIAREIAEKFAFELARVRY